MLSFSGLVFLLRKQCTLLRSVKLFSPAHQQLFTLQRFIFPPSSVLMLVLLLHSVFISSLALQRNVSSGFQHKPCPMSPNHCHLSCNPSYPFFLDLPRRQSSLIIQPYYPRAAPISAFIDIRCQDFLCYTLIIHPL